MRLRRADSSRFPRHNQTEPPPTRGMNGRRNACQLRRRRSQPKTSQLCCNQAFELSIGMDGWHDARLGSGGSAILSVTGKSLYGAVMQQHTLPGSGAAAQYWSVSETKHRQSDVWLTKESRLPLRASQPANSPQYLSSCFIYGVGTGII